MDLHFCNYTRSLQHFIIIVPLPPSVSVRLQACLLQPPQPRRDVGKEKKNKKTLELCNLLPVFATANLCRIALKMVTLSQTQDHHMDFEDFISGFFIHPIQLPFQPMTDSSNQQKQQQQNVNQLPCFFLLVPHSSPAMSLLYTSQVPQWLERECMDLKVSVCVWTAVYGTGEGGAGSSSHVYFCLTNPPTLPLPCTPVTGDAEGDLGQCACVCVCVCMYIKWRQRNPTGMRSGSLNQQTGCRWQDSTSSMPRWLSCRLTLLTVATRPDNRQRAGVVCGHKRRPLFCARASSIRELLHSS